MAFDVAKRLYELRNQAGMTIYRLSKSSNVADSFIRELEKGVKKNISVKVLEKICVALGITLAQFFQEEKVDVSNESYKRLHFLINKLNQEDIELLISFAQRIIDSYNNKT
jgi:transcriptional regulator with XRE-family HTH domain